MSEDERAAWAPLIAERREQLDLTQEQLAATAGVAEKTIYNIETGGRTPQSKTLRRIQSALGLSSDIEVARERVADRRREIDEEEVRDYLKMRAELERATPTPADWLRDRLKQAIKGRHGDDPDALLEVIVSLLRLMDEGALRVAFNRVVAEPMAHPLLRRPTLREALPGLFLDESEDIATGEADTAPSRRQSPGARD